ncbi:DUF397 domain-containing protein, partial [Nocardia brasiliensis]
MSRRSPLVIRPFTTSSFSGASKDCVEVGWYTRDRVAVRDSKNLGGG